MKVVFRSCPDLHKAAQITYDNMREYYERYSPDWDVKTIEETTRTLDNYELIVDEQVVGLVRLQFEDNACYLRDLQIKASHQNRGLGQLVLNELKCKAKNKGCSALKLRVFKISPALRLYKRNGFSVESEDERFFNLFSDLS